jgi:hypothetical protein
LDRRDSEGRGGSGRSWVVLEGMTLLGAERDLLSEPGSNKE